MPESYEKKADTQPLPPITALSTAYPMQFESRSDSGEHGTRGRRLDRATQPTREPHRHDAGE